ncbi:sulfurtransferase [Idiomarina tyrosinivorans]|uniref:Sulfurtransferase n=1 Tax=Idiomarina tyrosinivorans TaxID=1445662 RepID=A0A432ZLM8_9GAMM|nr:rhodanese-like domain-containing protein [Idiomarina tyrosinivorans]RUO78897.1 sulfurtransferase [Idiomarina tyrosinivorans]
MKNAKSLVDEARAAVKEVSIDELEAALRQGARIIDVREPAEFAQGHIREAANIPRGILEMNVHQHPDVAGYEDALQRAAAEPLYLICRSGGRSALAAESLQRMGFDKIYSVAGGMQAWEQSHKPMVKES